MSFSFEFEGHRYRATASRFEDNGRLAEIFLDAHKAGSALQLHAETAAILVSLLLQHHVAAETILHSVKIGPVAMALAHFEKVEVL